MKYWAFAITVKHNNDKSANEIFIRMITTFLSSVCEIRKSCVSGVLF
jgi:hypothetical protein